MIDFIVVIRFFNAMEIRNIKTFLKVAELNNFTQAAALLGYSQSAVTLQIQQLEKELGVLLFERIGRKVHLTEQGKTFHRYATSITNTLLAAEIEIKNSGQPSGKLKIGVIESLNLSVMQRVIREYHSLYPGVEISITTGLNSEMFAMLAKNEIDIIYFLDVQTDSSEWVKVGQRYEPTVFVCSSGNPLAQRRSLPLADVLRQPMILTEKSYCYRYALEQLAARRGIGLHPFIEMGNTDKIAELVADDMGISFLPLFSVQAYIERGALAVIDTERADAQMYSQLVYHKNKYVSPQMQAFMDVMKRFL